MLLKPRGIAQTGFTLIEIMLVILILGITSTIAVLAYRANDRSRATLNALILLEEKIQLAREYAIAHNTFVKLTITPHQAIFEKAIHTPSTLSNLQNDTFSWTPIEDYRALNRVKFDERLLIQHTPATNSPSIFYPLGTLTPMSIELQDPIKHTAYLLKTSNSGQINVEQIHHEQ